MKVKEKKQPIRLKNDTEKNFEALLFGLESRRESTKQILSQIKQAMLCVSQKFTDLFPLKEIRELYLPDDSHSSSRKENWIIGEDEIEFSSSHSSSLR